MDQPLRLTALLSVLLLAACSVTPSPLLQNLHQINPDGTESALKDKDLSSFQRILRARLHFPRPPQPVDELFACEMDIPQGDAEQGAYLAIDRSGKSVELRYFEQRGHLPYADRFFHRPLTIAETETFYDFLKKHPLATLLPQRSASQPASISSDAPVVSYRLTESQDHETQTRQFFSTEIPNTPAGELIKLLRQMVESGADSMACSYFQPIPPTAKLLYANPFRKVLKVWARGDDLRVIVSAPMHLLETPDSQTGQETWMAFKDNQWNSSGPPPVEPPPPPDEPTTQPATEPASQPATGPATIPSRFSNPGLLPQTEVWEAHPAGALTVVSHYIPLNDFQGERISFTVPALQFDDEHMSVDAAHQTIYLVHDGQLFALPIPPVARR